MQARARIIILIAFAFLAAGSTYYAFQLKFSFDFEQFFPSGDEDLEFFRSFIEEFETDDNFLLVALPRKEGVFEQSFLERVHAFTIDAKGLPYVEESQSLTKVTYPLKTPFGVTAVPAIHIDQPERYERDRARILNDERFVYNFISPDASTLVVVLKTINNLQLDQSEELMPALEALLRHHELSEYHLLGRAYFQRELVDMQKWEIARSAIISGILVTLIMFFIFRKPIGITIALSSVALGMLLFLGFMGLTGRELSAMAALYPVLMIIVGTSDVIHIMTRYIDELRKGLTRRDALRITVKEIGLATLLTSLTTAAGFASLATSRIIPIRDFGINAAIGVLIAFITVIFFTSALISWFRVEQMLKLGKSQAFWDRSMDWTYRMTRQRSGAIWAISAGLLILCIVGISMVTTNYRIEDNLPRGAKITEDYHFFEKQFAGFRPLELAVFAQDGYQATDYDVLIAMDTVEQFLRSQPAIRSVQSITTMYKTIHQMQQGNREDAYVLPRDSNLIGRYRQLAERIPRFDGNVLVNRDGDKARIAARLLDVGADSVKVIGKEIDEFIAQHVDAGIVQFRQTGTGLIIDKNSEYVRSSLLQGLGMAVLLVAVLMALLFRRWRLLVVAILPNIFPLLIAGALLGFLGIELEAGISIVFAVVFGIAVDDTIHFLSRFKLAQLQGYDLEQSLEYTLQETGKAIVLTTIVLFFGFLVMLFSQHPPSVTVGVLISATLFSAVFSDLFLLPVLLRAFFPELKRAASV